MTDTALDQQVAAARQLHMQGRIADAEHAYRAVLARDPRHFEATHLLGVAALQTGRLPLAVETLERAVGIDPTAAKAHNNLGNALRAAGQTARAAACFERARGIDPTLPGIDYNLGVVLLELGGFEPAMECLARAVAAAPGDAEALNNLGTALHQMGRFAEALARFDSAVAARPAMAEAHAGRGNVLMELRRSGDALAAYDRALALKPGLAEAWYNRGNALQELRRLDEAIASYDRAAALKPEDLFGLEVAQHARMKICDWTAYDSRIAAIEHKVLRGGPVASPYSVLALSGRRAVQRAASQGWVARKAPPQAPRPPLPPGERITIGYFSADLFDHATARLMAGMFEHHDRARFRTIAFSFGPPREDAMRARLRGAFDAFLDVAALSDREVAERARAEGVQVAVDLKGHTQDSRLGVFAWRPAPIQASHIGYPGTIAADYMDYLIADAALVPPEHEADYAEKIVRLPGSYQPNDRDRPVADAPRTRRENGLPETGFIFCGFNASYKITPAVLSIWMRLLARTPGSVLWLFEDNRWAAANLRREAADRGVDPARLVFAPPLPLPQHLARHAAADLFLDTLPVNAHTTASDALWAGLPVLTQAGESLVGRVAASLLHAAGLPGMVAASAEAYEALALDLAAAPDRLAAIRASLAAQRLTCPLFDTALFTRRIEAAYAMMVERARAGLPPQGFDIPA